MLQLHLTMKLHVLAHWTNFAVEIGSTLLRKPKHWEYYYNVLLCQMQLRNKNTKQKNIIWYFSRIYVCKTAASLIACVSVSICMSFSSCLLSFDASSMCLASLQLQTCAQLTFHSLLPEQSLLNSFTWSFPPSVYAALSWVLTFHDLLWMRHFSPSYGSGKEPEKVSQPSTLSHRTIWLRFFSDALHWNTVGLRIPLQQAKLQLVG